MSGMQICFNFGENKVIDMIDPINLGSPESRKVLELVRNPLSLQFLFVKTMGSIHCLEKRLITHLQAQGNYTIIFTKDRKVVSSKTLKHFTKLLENRMFIRVHQSYLVNVCAVAKFHCDSRSQLLLLSGITIPVSRSRKSDVVNLLQN